MFVSAMIMSASFVNNVSAQTENCASDKITTAYAPDVSLTVVINEAYGGSEATNGAFNADFIELYNLSAVPVNISDYSVQYYTAGQINAGAPTHTAHIPDATILAGNSFYVIRVSPIRATGASLPCENLNASATFAETGIAPDGGKLVLSSTGADLDGCTSTSPLVVDRVGYGITPIICNETSNAGAPSATTSVQRGAGSVDTDNNSADFTASSAPTPCAALSGPTAAMVNIGGRVTNADGSGISMALVRMTDLAGVVRTTYTAPFGYYRFDDVQAGETYVINVTSKRYQFTPRVVSVVDELTDVDFIAGSGLRDEPRIN